METRRAERLQRRLSPLLAQVTTEQAEQRLLLMQVQEGLLVLLQKQAAQPVALSPVQAELQHRETQALLLELLQATQPDPVAEISRLAGRPPLLTTTSTTES